MNLDEAQRLFERGPDGVQEWNRRRAAGEPIPSLREADLHGAELSGINLSGAKLLGACLCEAKIVDADLHGAILCGANLASVTAIGACFADADLRDSEFGVFSIGLGHASTSADVSRADFSRARLNRAYLSETIVAGARFCEADLTNADLRHSDFSGADTTNAKFDGVIWSDSSPEESTVHFGIWLREQRESRGMSPEELAAQLGGGLSAYDVTSLMEKKPDCASRRLALRLAQVFRIAVSDVPMRPVDFRP
jgi:uncharacterized protein YjbI with pentapeptide repeats